MPKAVLLRSLPHATFFLLVRMSCVKLLLSASFINPLNLNPCIRMASSSRQVWMILNDLLACICQGLVPSMASLGVSYRNTQGDHRLSCCIMCMRCWILNTLGTHGRMSLCILLKAQAWNMRSTEEKEWNAHRQHSLGCNGVCDPLWPQHRSRVPAASHAGGQQQQQRAGMLPFGGTSNIFAVSSNAAPFFLKYLDLGGR